MLVASRGDSLALCIALVRHLGEEPFVSDV